MRHKKEVIRDWIERCMDEARGLNAWEVQFLESISEQFDLRGSLSEAQEDKLEQIYVEKVP